MRKQFLQVALLFYPDEIQWRHCCLMNGVSSLKHLPHELSQGVNLHECMEKCILMKRVLVRSRLVFAPDNLCPFHSITSNFMSSNVPNLGQINRPALSRRHAHTPTCTKTQSQMSLFIIITNSAGILYYNRPILLGVTDHSRTWKAGIGHSQCGMKRIRDQHHSVSGDGQRLNVCAATVGITRSNELWNWRRAKWDGMKRDEMFKSIIFFFFFNLTSGAKLAIWKCSLAFFWFNPPNILHLVFPNSYP